jgi:hypothetical protein
MYIKILHQLDTLGAFTMDYEFHAIVTTFSYNIERVERLCTYTFNLLHKLLFIHVCSVLYVPAFSFLIFFLFLK